MDRKAVHDLFVSGSSGIVRKSEILSINVRFCGVGADWRTRLSGMSAARGSAPERLSFAYFSFPQKEKPKPS